MDKKSKVFNCISARNALFITKVNVLLKNSQIINVLVVMEITQVVSGYFGK